MKRIILITGGTRSGKSEYAEKLALTLSVNPVYLATAKAWDDEFKQRIIAHQQRRGPEWTNIEEEIELSRHLLPGRVVLIDCVTLWATNVFFKYNSEVQCTLEVLQQEFDRFINQDATFIFVTNEIGMGGTSEHPMQRHFSDLQGKINQYIAAKADELFLLVCGVPLKVK